MNKKMNRVKEIAAYIDENWDGFDICTDDFDIALHDIIYNFYFKKLNWCGCGAPALALKTVRDYLNVTSNMYDNYENRCKMRKQLFGVNTVYDNGLLLCLAYTLNAAELTEHGSSVGGAWLTEEGEMFLWCLNHIQNIDDYDL